MVDMIIVWIAGLNERTSSCGGMEAHIYIYIYCVSYHVTTTAKQLCTKNKDIRPYLFLQPGEHRSHFGETATGALGDGVRRCRDLNIVFLPSSVVQHEVHVLLSERRATRRLRPTSYRVHGEIKVTSVGRNYYGEALIRR